MGRNLHSQKYFFGLYLTQAEDVVSETVLVAFQSISKLRKVESFRPWIFRILINQCRRKMRDYVKKEVELSEEMAAVPVDINLKSDLCYAMESLSTEERFIVNMIIFGGYKGKEVGQILDIKHTTVRSKYRRALDKLKEQLL